MSNPLWGFISELVKPAADLVDNLHTSQEEKLALKNQLVALQMQAAYKLLDYETQLNTTRAEIVRAEAAGGSWLQRSWRPITMLTFLLLVCCDAFGWLPFRLAGEAWQLLQLGLGGYVIGRSAEKVAPALAAAITSTVGRKP